MKKERVKKKGGFLKKWKLYLIYCDTTYNDTDLNTFSQFSKSLFGGPFAKMKKNWSGIINININPVGFTLKSLKSSISVLHYVPCCANYIGAKLFLWPVDQT